MSAIVFCNHKFNVFHNLCVPLHMLSRDRVIIIDNKNITDMSCLKSVCRKYTNMITCGNAKRSLIQTIFLLVAFVMFQTSLCNAAPGNDDWLSPSTYNYNVRPLVPTDTSMPVGTIATNTGYYLWVFRRRLSLVPIFWFYNQSKSK